MANNQPELLFCPSLFPQIPQLHLTECYHLIRGGKWANHMHVIQNLDLNFDIAHMKVL